MAVSALFSVAVQGIQRQVDAMNGAANQVLIASTDPGTASDSVNISPAARQAASGASASPSDGGLENGLVNLNMSKYAAVANMKVLQTGDEMAQDLLDTVRPGGS